uniref:20 kDa chaperonin, chloroplastic n=1 Tax=Phaeomonas parva TaxID=124430 RepID=A0A7S1XUK7_9STRA|mmetsp:Transcript_38537/g.120643  ORF Transcript_38537/g.120643 Transcript_38537/m.120643 type:complete len:223 (+) Transcript_38537:378-1046(+)
MAPMRSFPFVRHCNIPPPPTHTQGTLVPDQNFVLVRLREAEEESEGGLFLPGTAREKPRDGEVVAAGPGKRDPETGTLLETEVKPGDKIVYGEYDGTRIVVDGVDYQVLEDKNILLIYEGDKPTITNARLLEDRIAVKLNGAIDETTRGVLIADSAQKDYVAQDGEVMAMGPGLRTSMGDRIPMDIKVGEFARFRDFVGADIDMDGENFRVVRMSEIVAKWQ